MGIDTVSRVTALLRDIQQLNASRHDLMQALRSQILALAPHISEEVKYGGILFAADQPFCGLFAYTNHVSLEFGDGAKLPDPFNSLEGSGKQRRHIKLRSEDDIAGKHVGHYLGLALNLSQQG